MVQQLADALSFTVASRLESVRDMLPHMSTYLLQKLWASRSDEAAQELFVQQLENAKQAEAQAKAEAKQAEAQAQAKAEAKQAEAQEKAEAKQEIERVSKLWEKAPSSLQALLSESLQVLAQQGDRLLLNTLKGVTTLASLQSALWPAGPTQPLQAAFAEGEGLSPFEAVKTDRINTCTNLVKAAITRGPILVRAPPFCGKTALAMTLLQPVCRSLRVKLYTVTMLCSKMPRFWDDLNAFICLAAEYPSVTCLLVVDEAQMSYNDTCGLLLWSYVKLQMQANVPKLRNLSVILFGTYGASLMAATPATFTTENQLCLQDILFTEQEMDELIKASNEHAPPSIGVVAAKALAQYTGRHPGLTRRVLGCVRGQFKSESGTTDADILHYLLGRHVANAVASTRCFINFDGCAHGWAPEAGWLLKTLLLKGALRSEVKFPVPSSEGERNILWHLVQHGVLAVNDGEYFFSSPAIARCYYDYFFSEKRAEKFPEDIDALLLQTLRQIPADCLRNSLGCNAGGELSERTWQMLFFRKLTANLPASCNVSPDVGAVFNTSGKLDFYIDSNLCWALELLIDGKGITEHVKRFAQAYAIIPRKAWRVVDIRSANRAVRKQHQQEVVHVLYTENWTEFLWLQAGTQLGPFQFA
eukprot:TRINITY_DN102_c0_g1_i6.p1 TRINITY_DN102_c0_g1~~TRINITY_DN102_c0_g1_i6.p1  ORF type:complete len:658 (-),score=124.26 TRINITY_DN102_c0_g1_i6:54-1982(-)